MVRAVALRENLDGSELRRLSNRIFKSYDDIVALRCEVWNKLIEQSWKIMSIGQRESRHGF